ncbi:NUDIX domain-containing protein [Neisseria sp. Ec49-e6-T10]|uniref:NUDIX domain-containing protein n=1 Tax=Neisseria sp. Ec49-e6-T10 TaxID=3140744 RepID=UPI003EC09DC3
MTQKNILHVVAGIIFNEEGLILLSSRPEGKSHAGFWEFAGGKVEAKETEFEALKRELLEELNIEVIEALPWLTKKHEYEHHYVYLHFFWVTRWQGVPQMKEQQQISWQNPLNLTVGPMLEANEPILKALSIPRCFFGHPTTQLQGSLFSHQLILKPSNHATADSGLLLNPEELHKLKTKPKSHQWVVAQINTPQEWEKCAQLKLDAAVLSITNIQELHTMFEALKNNMPTALIVNPTEPIHTKQILNQYACSIVEGNQWTS